MDPTYYLCLSLIAMIMLVEERNLQGIWARENSMPRNGTRKTIKTNYGDIIDCVDIHQQPTLSDPILKNHKIQLRPSDYQDDFKVSDFTKLKLIDGWLNKDECPNDTIPIRRQLKSKISTKQIRVDGNVEGAITDHKTFNQTIAQGHVFSSGMLAAQATFSIWNPKVESKEDYSLAQLTLEDIDRQFLEIGWIVYPARYGDNKTRLYIYFVKDEDTQGCFDFDCPGFIQVHPYIYIGDYLHSSTESNISVIYLAFLKDKVTKNWWAYVSGIPIGYWPNDLLDYDGFNNFYDILRVGGEISNTPGSYENITATYTTQMGSGVLGSVKDSNTTAFVRDIRIKDYWGEIIIAPSYESAMNNPNSYNVGELEDQPVSYTFFYGGPCSSSC